MNPPPAGITQAQQLFERIINLTVPAAFIILTIMLIYAGFTYLTSGGEKSLSQAHQTITWALLGILFLAIAWIILLLIQSFTGVQLTEFCIGFKPYCAF